MLFHKPHIPYIGVTGIVRPRESRAIVQAGVGQPTRKVMIGVLVSSNSLRGEANQWPNRHPTFGDIPGIFAGDPTTFNVIHYRTDQPESLFDQLLAVCELAGPELHGFQLNMAWPAPDHLRRFTEQRPDLQVILQLNQEAFLMARDQPGGIVAMLRQDYSGLVDHVLLDLSAGYGRHLDTDWARRQLQELQGADLGVGLGVAGGLSGTSLHLVGPLARDFPQLSIDAEARLRDSEDHLDLALAEDYLRKAFAMFGDEAIFLATEIPACG